MGRLNRALIVNLLTVEPDGGAGLAAAPSI